VQIRPTRTVNRPAARVARPETRRAWRGRRLPRRRGRTRRPDERAHGGRGPSARSGYGLSIGANSSCSWVQHVPAWWQAGCHSVVPRTTALRCPAPSGSLPRRRGRPDHTLQSRSARDKAGVRTRGTPRDGGRDRHRDILRDHGHRRVAHGDQDAAPRNERRRDAQPVRANLWLARVERGARWFRGRFSPPGGIAQHGWAPPV
jgi:hypothetical protein